MAKFSEKKIESASMFAELFSNDIVFGVVSFIIVALLNIIYPILSKYIAILDPDNIGRTIEGIIRFCISALALTVLIIRKRNGSINYSSIMDKILRKRLLKYLKAKDNGKYRHFRQQYRGKKLSAIRAGSSFYNFEEAYAIKILGSRFEIDADKVISKLISEILLSTFADEAEIKEAEEYLSKDIYKELLKSVDKHSLEDDMKNIISGITGLGMFYPVIEAVNIQEIQEYFINKNKNLLFFPWQDNRINDSLSALSDGMVIIQGAEASGRTTFSLYIAEQFSDYQGIGSEKKEQYYNYYLNCCTDSDDKILGLIRETSKADNSRVFILDTCSSDLIKSICDGAAKHGVIDLNRNKFIFIPEKPVAEEEFTIFSVCCRDTKNLLFFNLVKCLKPIELSNREYLHKYNRSNNNLNLLIDDLTNRSNKDRCSGAEAFVRSLMKNDPSLGSTFLLSKEIDRERCKFLLRLLAISRFGIAIQPDYRSNMGNHEDLKYIDIYNDNTIDALFELRNSNYHFKSYKIMASNLYEYIIKEKLSYSEAEMAENEAANLLHYLAYMACRLRNGDVTQIERINIFISKLKSPVVSRNASRFFTNNAVISIIEQLKSNIWLVNWICILELTYEKDSGHSDSVFGEYLGMFREVVALPSDKYGTVSEYMSQELCPKEFFRTMAIRDCMQKASPVYNLIKPIIYEQLLNLLKTGAAIADNPRIDLIWFVNSIAILCSSKGQKENICLVHSMLEGMQQKDFELLYNRMHINYEDCNKRSTYFRKCMEELTAKASKPGTDIDISGYLLGRIGCKSILNIAIGEAGGDNHLSFIKAIKYINAFSYCFESEVQDKSGCRILDMEKIGLLLTDDKISADIEGMNYQYIINELYDVFCTTRNLKSSVRYIAEKAVFENTAVLDMLKKNMDFVNFIRLISVIGSNSTIEKVINWFRHDFEDMVNRCRKNQAYNLEFYLGNEAFKLETIFVPKDIRVYPKLDVEELVEELTNNRVDFRYSAWKVSRAKMEEIEKIPPKYFAKYIAINGSLASMRGVIKYFSHAYTKGIIDSMGKEEVALICDQDKGQSIASMAMSLSDNRKVLLANIIGELYQPDDKGRRYNYQDCLREVTRYYNSINNSIISKFNKFEQDYTRELLKASENNSFVSFVNTLAKHDTNTIKEVLGHLKNGKDKQEYYMKLINNTVQIDSGDKLSIEMLYKYLTDIRKRGINFWAGLEPDFVSLSLHKLVMSNGTFNSMVRIFQNLSKEYMNTFLKSFSKEDIKMLMERGMVSNSSIMLTAIKLMETLIYSIRKSKEGVVFLIADKTKLDFHSLVETFLWETGFEKLIEREAESDALRKFDILDFVELSASMSSGGMSNAVKALSDNFRLLEKMTKNYRFNNKFKADALLNTLYFLACPQPINSKNLSPKTNTDNYGKYKSWVAARKTLAESIFGILLRQDEQISDFIFANAINCKNRNRLMEKRLRSIYQVIRKDDSLDLIFKERLMASLEGFPEKEKQFMKSYFLGMEEAQE